VQRRAVTTARCLAALAAAFALALPVPAAAQDDVPPTLLSPADGATVVGGTRVTFLIRTTPSEEHQLWLSVSRAPTVDLEGLIGTDADLEPFLPTDQPGVFLAATEVHDVAGFWMNNPGTYYWQAYRIHCPANYRDCKVESAIRKLTVTARPTTARIAIGPPSACHRAGDTLHVTGTGFTPSMPVDLLLGGAVTSTVNASAQGTVEAELKLPSSGSVPGQRTYRVTAREHNTPTNTATASVPATTFAYRANPASFQRRGGRASLSFAGFPTARSVYAHYRLDGRTRATVKLGRATGACGTLAVDAELIPARVVRAGTWVVQYDTRARYSARTAPRLLGKIRVPASRLR